jgi:hypothetical protein
LTFQIFTLRPIEVTVPSPPPPHNTKNKITLETPEVLKMDISGSMRHSQIEQLSSTGPCTGITVYLVAGPASVKIGSQAMVKRKLKTWIREHVPLDWG